MDPGATNTLVSSRAVQIIQSLTTSYKTFISGIQAESTTPSNKVTNLIISSLQQPHMKLHITAAVLGKLTTDLPFLPAPDVRKLPHLQGLSLADPRFDVPGGIDLLIGSDLMERVLLMESKMGSPGTASAYNTIFGWAVFGQYGQAHGNTNINVGQWVVEPEGQGRFNVTTFLGN